MRPDFRDRSRGVGRRRPEPRERGFRGQGPGFFVWQPSAAELASWLDELQPLGPDRRKRRR